MYHLLTQKLLKMKKIVTFSLLTLFSVGLNAQNLTSKKGESYLPEKGDWAISVDASGIFTWLGNLANNGTNGTISVGGVPTDYNATGAPGVTFVGKRFISDKEANRVIAAVNIGNSSTSTESGSGSTLNTEKVSTTGFNIAGGLGKEWRRGKTRLQGFYGADVYINVFSTSTKTTNTLSGTGDKEKVVGSGLGFGLGGNGFIGAEYFLFPKMAIGAQYQAGLNISMSGGGKTTTTPWTGNATETTGPKTTSVNVGPVGVASIRLTLHF